MTSDPSRHAPPLCTGYRLVRTRALVPLVPVDRLRAGTSCVADIVPPGETALAPVSVWSERAAPDRRPALEPTPAPLVPIQRPIGMPDQGAGCIEAVAHPPIGLARIENAVCVPGGVVLQGDAVLDASFGASWDTTQHKHLVRDGALWRLRPDRLSGQGAPPCIERPVLYLDDQNIDWFGHVIADLLGRAWAFDYLRLFLGVERPLVLFSANSPAFVRTLILAAGVPPEDLLAIDRPVQCRTLFLADKAMQVQHYVSPPAFRFWQGLRNRVGAAPRRADRLYVSRRANPTRRLMEEEAIEAIFARHGFTVLYPEATPILDQIRLFAGARLIAGCSGSNLFNLAFVGRAESVLVMASPLLIHHSERMFCSGAPRPAIEMLIGHVDPRDGAAQPGYVHAPWHLDPVLVEQHLRGWLGRHGEVALVRRP